MLSVMLMDSNLAYLAWERLAGVIIALILLSLLFERTLAGVIGSHLAKRRSSDSPR